MNKNDIKKRLLLDGKRLSFNQFNYCNKTNTVSTDLELVVFDFNNVADFKLIAGDNSIQTASYNSTQIAGDNSIQTASGESTQTAGSYSTQASGYNSTQTAGDESTQIAGGGSTQTAGDESTQIAGGESKQTAGSYSTQAAAYKSTHIVGRNSTVRASFCSKIYCKGDNVVISNCNVFEAIIGMKGDVIQICPFSIPGHIRNGLYNGEPHIIADGILSKVINKKGDVYHVVNYGETKQTYLIKKGDKWSHGETLEQAREGLIYKLSDRDSSKYKDHTLDTVLSLENAVQCYMAITGACESGTKYFVDNVLKDKKDSYLIKELIKLTKGQYGSNEFEKFFNK